MSWLSELADKAENLLNKIDQNAAAVLQEKDKTNLLNFHLKNGDVNTKKHQTASEAPTSKSDLNIEPKSNLKAISLKKGNKKSLESNESPTRSKPPQSIKQSSSFAHFTSINEGESNHFSDTSSLKDAPVSFDILDNSHSDASPTHSVENLNRNENTSNESHHGMDYFVTMENQLLKNEINVVNNEVSLLIGKVKSAERIAEESRSRMKQMETKHTQLQEENENLQTKVHELESQMNLSGRRLSQNTNDSEDEIESLKSELQELQIRIPQLEHSEMSLISQKNELENDLSESQNKCKLLEERLEKMKSELANVQSEWKNYKIRANSTLTMKEKLIEELGGNIGGINDDLVNNLNNQITQLKTERDEAVEEVTKIQNDSEIKDKEIELLEARLTNTERQYSILKDAFRQEKVAKEMAEHNANALSKEIKSLQIETANQISSLRTKLRDNQSKENEHLSTQSASTSMHVSESGDERFRLLTQALVAKQAALESVTSDRNALRLQLEKTETKYRSDLIKMKNNQPRLINVNDTDDVKARFPSMMQENPWDSHFSRGAKRVYSTLDSFSVRVGVFLRRNPLARIFIISYMILLHLWVCIVLFSYTPEPRITPAYRKQ